MTMIATNTNVTTIASSTMTTTTASSSSVTATTARRRGGAGMLLASGEQVLTTSGRVTTPFPRIDMSASRRAASTLRRVDAWLLANARTESQGARHRRSVALRTGHGRGPQMAEVGNLSSADKDTCEMILFEPELWQD